MRYISRNIGTILSLKDLFSPTLKKTVDNTKQFQRQVQHAQNDVGKFRDKVSSSFGSIKSKILSFGAGLTTGLSFQNMIASAEAGQKAVAQLGTVYKSTGGAVGLTQKQLLDLAAAQSRVTTYSKGANIETEKLLMTFTNIKGGVFKQALGTVNDMSTALGQSTKSSAIQLGKALQDPIKGVTALSKVGVNFTDQQKSTIKSLVGTGQTAKAQQIILGELNKEFGGQAKAAGATFQGTMARIKNTITGLGGSIGSTLMPYMTSFSNVLIQKMPAIQAMLSTVINTATPLIAGIFKDIGQITKNLFPGLGGSAKTLQKNIQTLIANGLGAVKSVFDWIAQHGEVTRLAVIGIGTAFAGWKIASTAMTVIGWLNKIKKTAATFSTLSKGGSILKALFGLPPQVTILIAVIAAIAMGAYLVITHWKQLKLFFAGLWTWFKQSVVGLWNWLKTFMSTWGGILLTIMLPVLGVPLMIITHWSQLKAFFANLGARIKATWNAVVNWFATLPGRLYQHGRNMFTSFKNGAWSIISGIGGWIKDKFNSFINFFKNLPKSALKWGKDIVSQLKAGIHAKVSDVVNEAKSLGKKILDGIKNIFGIASPSKEMFKIGNYLVKGLENGIFKGKTSLKTVISKIFGGALDFTKGLFGGSGDVSGWLTTALAITGQSMSNLPALMKVAMNESGGNPKAINLWDSNAAAGHPSKGLMQTIDSTFNKYSIKGLGDIWNPIANAVASIRYMIATYGSIANVPGVKSASYVGYKNGTNSAVRGVANVAEDTAEIVVGKQARNFQGGEKVINGKDTKKLLGGRIINLTNHFHFTGNVGSEEFFTKCANITSQKILTELDNM